MGRVIKIIVMIHNNTSIQKYLEAPETGTMFVIISTSGITQLWCFYPCQ